MLNEKQYVETCEIEELLKIVGNGTSIDDKNSIALDFLSDLISYFEDKHFSIKK